jgi:hypothetical protein
MKTAGKRNSFLHPQAHPFGTRLLKCLKHNKITPQMQEYFPEKMNRPQDAFKKCWNISLCRKFNI